MAVTITLPEHIQTWNDRQVAEGRYASTDAVIANAVEQAMDVPYRWEDDQDLLDAIAQADRDEGELWTPELMDRIVEEAMENSRRGHKVSDDIKYCCHPLATSTTGRSGNCSIHIRNVGYRPARCLSAGA